MRVIAGKFRSRPIASLRGMDLRPTSDRLRETLFNVLTAGHPDRLEGTVWLDLYAGTGAVGIEALSRGARMVHFVDSSTQAADLIRNNLTSLGLRAGFEVWPEDAQRAIAKIESRGILPQFIFLDPPYRMEGEYQRTLRRLGSLQAWVPDSLVITEHDKRYDPGETFGTLSRVRRLQQGDAALSFYRLA